MKELQLKEQKLKLVQELPHRYGFPFYKWMRKFYESTNRLTLLCSANQIGKSSIQIRRVIELATNTALWPKFWKQKPNQFWYLYPSRDVASAEFLTKWQEFLPRGEMKTHPIYGWREVIENKRIHCIHFNSGVTIYFKTYAQDVQTLQSGTVYYIACDEELPGELWDELQLRTAAVDGLISLAFTATLGQELWYRAIEGQGSEELFPDALKIQVSMYDCMYYEDGSVGNYDEAKIERIKRMCKSEAEVQRRIYGRFVKDSGRVYQSFDPTVHYVRDFELTRDHKIYSGVDIGGGGEGHPAAITFVAVTPDHTKGYVFRFWRGDGVLTTASDVLQKYREMRGDLKPVMESYDFQAKDFGTIAARMGEPFVKAEKSHDIGEGVFNALFKNNALFLVDQGDEIRKLGMELMSLQEGMHKSHAKDDGIDSCRYAIVRIPWNWEAITKHSMPTFEEKVIVTRPLTDAEYRAWEIDERRGVSRKSDQVEGWKEIDAEFDHWNGEYGN